MKLKTTLKRETRIKATIAFEVEFDTETGETEIVGDGRVVQHEEIRRRRALQHEEEPDQIDEDTYRELLTTGQIPIPKPGDSVMLNGKIHILDPQMESCLDEGESLENPENIMMFLGTEQVDESGFSRRRRRRR